MKTQNLYLIEKHLSLKKILLFPNLPLKQTNIETHKKFSKMTHPNLYLLYVLCILLLYVGYIYRLYMRICADMLAYMFSMCYLMLIHN